MLTRVRQRFADWFFKGLHIRGASFGEASITISPAGVGDLLRWSATKAAVALGDLGMDVTTGLPSVYTGGAATPLATGPSASVSSITVVANGGGIVIAAGVSGDIQIPFACTINSWTILGDQSGSIVFDIWKAAYAAGTSPTVANTITAAAKPTVTATINATSSTLTGWTTTIAAGDCLRFNVDSITTMTRATLVLKVTRT